MLTVSSFIDISKMVSAAFALRILSRKCDLIARLKRESATYVQFSHHNLEITIGPEIQKHKGQETKDC